MSERELITDWWSSRPMTYGRTHGATDYAGGEAELGSREFFERADRQLYAWNAPLHRRRPFDRLFAYDAYRGRNVLEIGCGMGAMAANWAASGACVTAVDLTPVAIEQTRRRFALAGLDGDIRQADARRLPFPDQHFDYVYSWGVLHHSPDLSRSVAELVRVLRPGGGFGVMLYHRHSFLYGYMVRFLEGFLHRESRFLAPLALASRYGDGAREEGNPHTWPIAKSEARMIFGAHSRDMRLRVLGTDLDGILPFVLPGLGHVLPRFVKKPWARRFGWSLWIEGHRG
ncbi:MAG TPA: class I SAM-dependent methyltransferase [Stellaceae bacterium]|nr:class I SAM-dependent methyltransferase [Stellaceae bacterium]